MFTNASDLGTISSASLSFRTENATRQAGEPAHSFSNSRTVWWRWTAPSTGELRVRVDTGFSWSGCAVYTGTALESLTQVEATSGTELVANVIAGTTYHLVIGGNSNGSFRLEHFPPPPNDNFANRASLGSVASFQIDGRTFNATREAGEPAFDFNPSPGPSVWYSWQAPQDGIVRFDLAGSIENNWSVGVYTGSTLAGLTERLERSYSSGLSDVSVFRVKTGETLAIAVARSGTNSTGRLRLNWSLTPNPYQDTAAEALDLGSVTTADGHSNNFGAIGDLSAFQPGVWWKWTAPISGIASWGVTAASGIAAQARAYGPDMTYLAFGSSSTGEAGLFACHAGETYYLLVSMPSSGQGEFDYHLSLRPSPANDYMDEAAPLVLGENPFETYLSSVEAEEPDDYWDHSVWWEWTAPSAGGLIIDWDPKDYYLLVAYRVAPDGTLTEVVRSSDDMVVHASPSERYLIGVVIWSTQSWKNPVPGGHFKADFSPTQTGNDAFANAIDLGSTTSGRATGDPATATVEPGEPPVYYPSASDRSLWWKWTAPSPGVFGAVGRLPGNQTYTNEPALKWYRGSTLATLAGLVTNTVASGDVIYIAVTQQPDGTTRPVTFEYQFIPFGSNDALANTIDLGSVPTFNIPATLAAATIEPNEPPHWHSPTRSLWWKWTAPADLNLALGLWNGSTRNDYAYVDVYVPNGSGGLTQMPYQDLYPATAGTTYYLSLISTNPHSGDFRMISKTPLPGDRFDHPADLGSAADATLKAVSGVSWEPADSPLVPGNTSSIYWRWTAPASGLLSFDASFDSSWKIVREDSPGSLVPVVSPVTVSPGQTYRIVAFGTATFVGDQGYLKFAPFPPNDLRVNATDLGTGANASASSILRAASVEAGEDALFPNQSYTPSGTVWWTWTAPFSGALRVNALSGASATGVAVLTGPSAATASLITSATNESTGPAETLVAVTAGNRYWIMVGSRYAAQDTLTTLTLEAWPTLQNDHWRSATDLGNAERADGEGRNDGAISESFEPLGRYGSVWWKWTAPRTGNAIISADVSSTYDEVIAVYQDSGGVAPLAVNSRSMGNSNSGEMSVFRAQAGETYYLMVATRSQANGRSIHIAVDLAERAPNDDFGFAIPLSGSLPLTVTGNAHASTWEAAEPEVTSNGGSLWWNWTAPSSGRVLATYPGGYGLSVYTGPSLGSLTVAANESTTRWAAWQVTAGVTYRLRLAGEGPVSLKLETITLPTNDLFANRQSLGTSNTASITGHNFFATSEANEPAHAGTAAARSIWYRWTPATTGRYEIDTSASGLAAGISLSLRIGVYRGSSLTTLTPVASGTSRVGFTATAGVEQVFAIDYSQSTPVSIEIRPLATPPNDNFANRTILTGKAFVLSGNSIGATVETSEPLPGSSALYPRSLWWEWTAPLTGTVQVNLPFYTAGTSPVLRVFTSSNSSPAFSNLSLVSIYSSFSATNGVRYFFQVASTQFQPASGDSFRYESTYSPFTTRLTVTPPNDRFASWTDIGQATGVEISGDVSGATLEPGQSGSSSVGSIGWKWTAPASGWFAIRRQLNSTPQLIRILRGATWSTLTTVASGSGEYLWFQATAGESLWIEWQSSSVSESSATSPSRFASFAIIQENSVAPANDAFTSPQALPAGLTGSTSGSTASATAEAGEPAHGGTSAARSVWYEWTAAATGPVSLSATSATMRAGVYTGSSLASLVTVASEGEPLLFNAVAGTTYRIALDSATPANFSLTLREPAVAPANDHFANSILLTGAQGSTSSTTRNATLENGESLYSSSTSASTWWHWTAPDDGPVTWQASNSQVDISAFTGSDLGSLDQVFSGNQKLRFQAVAGITYRISTSSYSSFDFTLSWQQQATGPANDNFAQAIVLPGTPSSVAGTLVGSSYEDGEPRHANGSNSAIERSVWYAWTAPTAGAFRLTAESAVSPTLCVYRNGALDTLDAVASGVRALDFSATAGVTYHIAVVGPAAANEQPFQLKIEAKSNGDHDMFANRIHLGNASSLTWEGSTHQATQEPGEPRNPYMGTTQGTRWWSWTAPSNGAAILRRLEPSSNSSDPDIAIYTGTVLADLVEIDATDATVLAFPVTAGTTYQIQISDSGSNFLLQLSMAALEHDRFSDPLILPSTLPVSSEIPASGASTQPAEPGTGRSVWWRWIAPADGWVDVDFGASDFGVSLWVGQGNALTDLTAVTLSSSGTEIRRFFAIAGTAYSISAGCSSESYLGMVRITLSAASGTAPANDNFAAALPLAGESATVTSTSRGATTEADERVSLSSTHSRSLWWTWVAPRDGVVTLRTTIGWSLLYQGNALASLAPVAPLGGFAGLYPVTAGQSYRIAAGNSAGSDFTLELALSPVGDLFSQPVALASVPSLTLPSSITGCSYETGEPYHGPFPASRSRWFQWTATSTGPYRIVADGASSYLRVAVYTGPAMNALTNRGRGTRAALFTATAGQTYHIAVDAASDGSGGDFMLSIAPEPAAYTAWRDANFEIDDTDAGPDSDPDGDGRANLIELALGSGPHAGDSGAPFQFSTTAGPVHLQARHASNLGGWHLGFDVSPSLASWVSSDVTPHTRWTEDHGDGTSTLHVILTDYDASDFPTLLFRLRVEEDLP